MDNAEIRDFIDSSIKENEVMLFMKGTPEAPACGFSMRTSGALNALGVRYAALDILPDPRIREELSGLSGWPTIPQLFVKGELVGGCDIVVEMYENGELAELLGVDMPEEDDAPAEDEPVELPQQQIEHPAGEQPQVGSCVRSGALPAGSAKRRLGSEATATRGLALMQKLQKRQARAASREPAARSCDPSAERSQR